MSAHPHRPRRHSIRTIPLLAVIAALLSACPAPVVRPPSTEPKPPVQRPTPPSTERPTIRPPIQGGHPQNIALLLPLSGRQEAAGIAVRDGFLAAWFEQEVERRPNIRIYDVAGSEGMQSMSRAINEGAQFIVGPLVKDDVIAAATAADGRLPVLALNFLPDDTPAPHSFYQFALSPEDEARQVAQRLVADGRPRGVVLVPIGDWGTRVLNAFTQELTQLGGDVAARSAYDTDSSDHSPVIQQLFRLGDSRERHSRLVSMLGTKLEFEPRRRGDAQFIFVAAQPTQGRQIRPQLKFHYAGDVPMYATSDIFEADPTANIDLDGVTLPLMPWVLGTNPGAADARAAVERAWTARVNRRGSLYAFGYDAWQLIPELISRQQNSVRSTNERIDGVTGRLRIDTDGRIHRELDWAQIRGGKPTPLPPSAH